RLSMLLDAGVPGNEILILTPQRSLATPYYDFLRSPSIPPGGMPAIQTLGGVAQRLVELFWPLISKEAGFSRPDLPPIFLTLETAQYYLSKLVVPLIDEGMFESVKVDRNRIFSQILDNLNKASVVGFPISEIGERLMAASMAEQAQQHVFEEAQKCGLLFRKYCLENNLLDYSLQIELFTRFLWPSLLPREFLLNRYHHLIYDNIEEDVPVAHDVIEQWLPIFDSALLIADSNGGYRTFLGADPDGAERLAVLCDTKIQMDTPLVAPEIMRCLGDVLGQSILGETIIGVKQELRSTGIFINYRFAPQMAESVCTEVVRLVNDEGMNPGEIAILAPFLSDSLRFTLSNLLRENGIPVRSHRPSRSLREEPATRALLNIARLAYPEWGMPITQADLRSILMELIEGCDLVRADLISRMRFFPAKKEDLLSFDTLPPENQERITFSLGERYEHLRLWLLDYRQSEKPELDVFLSRLFGELLSQPGYSLHTDFDSVAVVSRLIESIQKFRRVVRAVPADEPVNVGLEYLRMVEQGILAAQYLQPLEDQTSDAVLLSPAYTFLMSNRPVSVQFWLDSGSRGWFERLAQPLTQPYVLTRSWPPGRQWTFDDENRTNQMVLSRLVQGLVQRCRERVYLVSVELNEQGSEDRGPLLRASQGVLRKLVQLEAEGD
ncbi:MAG: hypothetical protein HGA53_09320, partial [Anaerolineaceae bacterium]|nr:hypothetical protein [Anaerolineaceae bacterium]